MNVLDLYAGEDIRHREVEPWRTGTAHGFEFWSAGEKAAGSSIGTDEIPLFARIAELIGMETAYTIGVAFGLSTFVLALARPQATVYAIDDYSERRLANSRARPLVERLIREHCPNVRLHVGRSPDETPAALFGLQKPLDLLFIDGMHTDQAAGADYAGCLPYLGPKSVVLWHDADTVKGAFHRSHDPKRFDTARILESYGRTGVYYNRTLHPELDAYLDGWVP